MRSPELGENTKGGVSGIRIKYKRAGEINQLKKPLIMRCLKIRWGGCSENVHET